MAARTFRIAMGLRDDLTDLAALESKVRLSLALVTSPSSIVITRATLVVDPVVDVIGALDALSRAGLNVRAVRWLNVSENVPRT